MTKDELEDTAFQKTARTSRRNQRALMVVACFLYVVALLAACFVKPRLAAIPVALGGMLCSVAALIVEATSVLRNDHKALYDLLNTQTKQQDK